MTLKITFSCQPNTQDSYAQDRVARIIKKTAYRCGKENRILTRSINRKLLKANSCAEVFKLWKHQGSDFNTVNFATALHKLAKLKPKTKKQYATIHKIVLALFPHLEKCDAQSLTTIPQALTAMKFQNTALFTKIQCIVIEDEARKKSLQGYSSEGLFALVHAYSMPHETLDSAPLMSIVKDELLADEYDKLSCFSLERLVTIAFAYQHYPDTQDLYEAISRFITKMDISRLSCSKLVNVATLFSSKNAGEDAFFLHIAHELLRPSTKAKGQLGIDALSCHEMVRFATTLDAVDMKGDEELLFERIEERFLENNAGMLDELSADEIVSLALSFHRKELGSKKMFELIKKRFLVSAEKFHGMSLTSLAFLVSIFAERRDENHRVLFIVCQKNFLENKNQFLPQCSVKELAHLAHAFSLQPVVMPKLFSELATYLLENRHMFAQASVYELVLLADSFAKQTNTTQDFFDALAQEIESGRDKGGVLKIESFFMEELTSTLEAFVTKNCRRSKLFQLIENELFADDAYKLHHCDLVQLARLVYGFAITSSWEPENKTRMQTLLYIIERVSEVYERPHVESTASSDLFFSYMARAQEALEDVLPSNLPIWGQAVTETLKEYKIRVREQAMDLLATCL